MLLSTLAGCTPEGPAGSSGSSYVGTTTFSGSVVYTGNGGRETVTLPNSSASFTPVFAEGSLTDAFIGSVNIIDNGPFPPIAITLARRPSIGTFPLETTSADVCYWSNPGDAGVVARCEPAHGTITVTRYEVSCDDDECGLPLEVCAGSVDMTLTFDTSQLSGTVHVVEESTLQHHPETCGSRSGWEEH
jgi:hypothetical protein